MVSFGVKRPPNIQVDQLSSKNSEKQPAISAKASVISRDISPVNSEGWQAGRRGAGEQDATSSTSLRNRFGFKNVVKMNKEKGKEPTTSYPQKNEDNNGIEKEENQQKQLYYAKIQLKDQLASIQQDQEECSMEFQGLTKKEYLSNPAPLGPSALRQSFTSNQTKQSRESQLVAGDFREQGVDMEKLEIDLFKFEMEKNAIILQSQIMSSQVRENNNFSNSQSDEIAQFEAFEQEVGAFSVKKNREEVSPIASKFKEKTISEIQGGDATLSQFDIMADEVMLFNKLQSTNNFYSPMDFNDNTMFRNSRNNNSNQLGPAFRSYNSEQMDDYRGTGCLTPNKGQPNCRTQNSQINVESDKFQKLQVQWKMLFDISECPRDPTGADQSRTKIEEESLDCISRMSLEIGFQRYLEASGVQSGQENLCHFRPGFTAHFDKQTQVGPEGQVLVFQCLCSGFGGSMSRVSCPGGALRPEPAAGGGEEDSQIKLKVVRFDPNFCRPTRVDHQKYLQQQSILPQSVSDGPFQEASFFWLVKQYLERNGVNDLFQNLKEGLYSEIEAHERSQFEEIDAGNAQNEAVLQTRLNTWSHIIDDKRIEEDMASMGYFDPTVFHDCDNYITQLMLRLYSMDSFLTPELNRATLQKDESKVQTLGPLAVAIRSLLFGANDSRESIQKMFPLKVYKGMILSEQELIQLKKFTLSKGKRVPMTSFTSASMSRDFIEKKLCEAVVRSEMDLTPVLIEIKLLKAENVFILNSSRFTHFSEEEEEVILQDGVEVVVERELRHRPIGSAKQSQYLQNSHSTTMNTSSALARRGGKHPLDNLFYLKLVQGI